MMDTIYYDFYFVQYITDVLREFLYVITSACYPT